MKTLLPSRPLETCFFIVALMVFASGANLDAREIQPLTESTLIEVVNQVEILKGEDLSAIPAEESMVFRSPDFLQTGRRSRARMEADDGTITRVGSNTLFSFDQNSRTINLKKGSILFHSPEGRGGGRVVTASATASVIGTTIAVAATADGGFKLLVLEGTAQVSYPDGTIRVLEAGQMTFVLPTKSVRSTATGRSAGVAENSGDGRPGPVLNFDLSRMTEDSSLLNGFSERIESQVKIEAAITKQEVKISKGTLNETNARIVEVVGDSQVVLDVSNTDTVRITNVDSQPNLSPQIERLSKILLTEVTPQTEGFDEFNFVDAPGIKVPRDLVRGLNSDEVVLGFLAGRMNLISGGLDVSSIGIPDASDRRMAYYLRAADTMTLSGAFVPTGFTSPSKLQLSGREAFRIAANSGISIDNLNSTNLSLDSYFGDIDGSNVVIENAAGGVRIFSELGEVAFSDSILTAGIFGNPILPEDTAGITIADGPVNELELHGQNVKVVDGILTAANRAKFQAVNSIVVDSTSIKANFIELSASDIKSALVSYQTSDLKMRASNQLRMETSDLTGVTAINLGARTLILSDVQFSSASNIQLGSANGLLAPLANTGAAALPGFVNFINAVTVDSNPAQNYVSVAQGGTGLQSQVINLYSTGP